MYPSIVPSKLVIHSHSSRWSRGWFFIGTTCEDRISTRDCTCCPIVYHRERSLLQCAVYLYLLPTSMDHVIEHSHNFAYFHINPYTCVHPAPPSHPHLPTLPPSPSPSISLILPQSIVVTESITKHNRCHDAYINQIPVLVIVILVVYWYVCI